MSGTGRGTLGKVLDGSGDPLGRVGTGRGTLGEVQDGSGTLKNVRDVSGNHRRGLGRVGGPSRKSGKGWESLGKV